MKSSLRKFSQMASGYGGMLFIAVLGLSVLIFGGILTNARQTRELRSGIAALERAREQQTQLKPLLASIAAHQRSLATDRLPATVARPLPASEIASVAPAIASISQAAGIDLVSLRHLLQPDVSDSMSLRIEIRLDGELPAFRRFLENLLAWEHPALIEGFTLQPAQSDFDFQLVIQLPVT